MYEKKQIKMFLNFAFQDVLGRFLPLTAQLEWILV